MKKLELKKKFIIYFSIGTIGSIIFVFLFMYYLVMPNLFEKEELSNKKVIEAKVDNIEKFLQSKILQTKELGESINNGNKKQNINEKIKHYKDFKGAFVFNKEGYSYGDIPINKELILSKLKGKDNTFVFGVQSKQDNNLYIATKGTVKGHDGYIVTTIDKNSIKELIGSNNKYLTNIYDSDGKKLLSMNSGINVNKEDIQAINSKYQTLNTSIIKHNDKIAVIENILPSGWSIVNIANQKDFYSLSWVAIYKFIQIAVLLVVLLFITFIFVNKVLLKMLETITEWMQSVRSNNFDIKVASNEVFPELTESFKDMIDKIKSNYDSLQKQTEELYERNWQVEETNRELEESYERLQETINQLNEAEEKYYALVKNLPEIVCIMELDGTIIFVNEAVKDILGYKKEELIGKDVSCITKTKSSKKLINIMNKKLKRRSQFIAEIPLMRKDGEEIISEAKLAYHWRNGDIDGVQIIIRDITKKKKLQKEIMHKNEELLTIYNISRSLSSTIELDNVFNLIVNEVCKILDANLCVLRLLDGSEKNLNLKSYTGDYFNGISEESLKDFETLKVEKVSEVINSKQVMHLDVFDEDWIVGNFNDRKPEREKVHNLTFVPICAQKKVLGIISVGTYEQIDEKSINILLSIAYNAAVAIDNATLYEKSKKYFIKTIDALIAAVEAKDKYTEGHSRRVSKYVEILGKALGLSKEKVEDLRVAGILHDVGKIGISDNILLKPGKLTDEEYEEVKQHPIISNRILYSVGLSEVTMKAIACHHERYDGKGYPFGLKEEELDIECQIIGVADAFDAMTSNRAYRRALSYDEAIEEIIKNKGKQFGPSVVDVLLDIYQKDPERLTMISKEDELAG